jgi:hypothetical protein
MTTYLVALLIVGVSVLLGRAICVACAADTAIAPALGLAALMAVAALAVQLPGHAVTGAVLVALVVVGAAWWLVHRRALGRRGLDLAVPLAGGGAAVVGALQFLSAGHVGIPGMSVNNDTGIHLVWAEGLRSSVMDRWYTADPGYPLGPHSIMAALADGTGTEVDRILVALLIATPVLFAMTAAGALRPAPLLLRAPAAAFAAVTYMAAAWFAQGAFKEPLLALFVLGFAMAVGRLVQDARPLGRAQAVPAGVLAAAGLLTFGHLALAWLGAVVVIVVVLALVARPPDVDLLGPVRRAAVPIALGVAALVVAVAVEIPRLWHFFSTIGSGTANAGAGGPAGGGPALGNLAGPLPSSEALGMWPWGDFRVAPPPDTFMFSQLKTLALVSVVAGAVWLLVRRRDLGLLGALGAAVAVWIVSDRGKAPYVTAKSMAVMSPFLALVWLRALLPDRLPRAPLPGVAFVARIGIAAVLVSAGLWSTEKVLRGTPVESLAQRDALEQMRPLVKSANTLFLGVDDYAGYRLREVPVGYLGVGYRAPIAVPTRPTKGYNYSWGLDWDNIPTEILDRYKYVITVNSPYASAPPANFRLLRRNALYEAWERTGPTPPRQVFETGDGPGAVLDCKQDRKARRLSRRRGVAAIEDPAPIPVLGIVPPMFDGGAYAVDIILPPGNWDLAFKYTSSIPVRIQYGPARIGSLPANTTRPGPWWRGPTIRSNGHAQKLVLVAERQSRFGATAYPTQIYGAFAVKQGSRDRLVPLRRACGRYLDWYRTDRGAAGATVAQAG